MKMIDSPLCTFCKISGESIKHLFFEELCDFIAAFYLKSFRDFYEVIADEVKGQVNYHLIVKF